MTKKLIKILIGDVISMKTEPNDFYFYNVNDITFKKNNGENRLEINYKNPEELKCDINTLRNFSCYISTDTRLIGSGGPEKINHYTIYSMRFDPKIYKFEVDFE